MLKLVDQIITSTGSMTPSVASMSALATREHGAIGAAGGIGLTPKSGSIVRYAMNAVGSTLIGATFLTGAEYQSRMAFSVNRALGATQVHQPESAAAGHRVRELKFQESHPEAFCPFVGQWVVLEGETIVAHGSDPIRVVAEARSRAVRVPYVFFVEEPKEDSVWIGL